MNTDSKPRIGSTSETVAMRCPNGSIVFLSAPLPRCVFEWIAGFRFDLALLTAVAVGLAGCSKTEEHAGHDHDHGKMHVHVAPHGGTLVELGEHEANLELIRDGGSGKLTGYVLDAHAENFLRIAAPAFDIVAKVDGRDETLAFKPVANAATGNVGDTSQYEAQADWLKATATFDGVVRELEIRAKTYRDVKFSFPGRAD